MKATFNLSWMPYNLMLRHPFTISTYSRTTTPVVLVKIVYEGLVGYGEASLPQYLGESQESVIAFLKKVDLNQFHDLSDLSRIMSYIDSLSMRNTAAKAAVDIALHDLWGKFNKKPLHQLFCLNKENTPYTTYTIGMDSDEVVKKKTEEVADKFKILKVKLGGIDDKRMINVIRSVTDLPLAIDANQGWKDRVEALDMINWLHEKGCVLIEQPMEKSDLDNHAWLTEKSPIPIFADESVQRLSDLERIKGAFSGINIKLMKCTGLLEARKMLELAPSLGFKTMLGCMTETSCAISAASQLSPLVDFADLDGALLISNDCFEGTKIVEGKVQLNDGWGIGAELRIDVWNE